MKNKSGTDEVKSPVTSECVEVEKVDSSILLPLPQYIEKSKFPEMLNSENLPSHYIGIGASAGGLEAIQRLFDNMPDDTGASFIVVQHLSPDFKSVMAELIGKHTNMPVYTAFDQLKLQRNSIYLMPARKNMLIAEGILLLADQEPGLHLPIDIFFRSLAEDKMHKSAGIVLSGTGSDGSRGIKAIKESGGLVIVQEPADAKFNGMPFNAVSTGCVDYIIPAMDIADNLVKYIRHPLISGDESSLKSHIHSNEDLMNEIFVMLNLHCNIEFSDYKPSTVARRIERRMGINQITVLTDYYQCLLENSKELDTLSKELLVGVTRFFRDDEAFVLIEHKIVDEILNASGPNTPIRIWSAACSTGEEAYSLAILFKEAMLRRNEQRSIKIFATDVDADSIADASCGQYGAVIEQDMSKERLSKYFELEDDFYVVNNEIRQMVIFATHNMISDPPFSNINMVICRNALIYFQNATQKKVLVALHFSLKQNGILLLGPSESLGELHAHFETVDERMKLFRKLSNVRIPIGTPIPLKSYEGPSAPQGMLPINNLLRSHREYSKTSPIGFIKDVLIEKHVPSSVILSEDLNAMHVYGDVGDYFRRLPAGRVSANVGDLINDDLSIAVSTALYRAQHEKGDIHYDDLLTSVNGEQVMINIMVSFVKENNTRSIPGFFILTFLPQNRIATTEEKITNRFNMADQSRQRILDLEQELQKKQEHLQITVEELETTNEELQSANEELMSANEELQSTNEELQSVNEELYTVNSEYQDKITELVQSNRDLDSVIESIKIGVIFLDETLLVRRFTAIATDYFNFLPGDIGRPIHHISHNLLYEDFIKDVSDASRDNKLIEREVITHDGRGLLMRINVYAKAAPYFFDGIVVTFSDVTTQKIVERALEQACSETRDKLELDDFDHSTHVNVLLIDDHRADRQIIRNYLNAIVDVKYSITEAVDINEGIEKAKANLDFDICLLDCRLAGDTAAIFLNAMKKVGLAIPTIILSGSIEAGSDESLLEMKIEDFLSKDKLSPHTLRRSIFASMKTEELAEV